jgi:hypothetical protein
MYGHIGNGGGWWWCGLRWRRRNIEEEGEWERE